MNDNLNPLESIQEIKTYMQKSTRFLSLSGWSGIWVGICGTISGILAYIISLNIYTAIHPSNSTDSLSREKSAGYIVNNYDSFWAFQAPYNKLLLLAAITFIIAIAGGYYFSMKKARKEGALFNHVFKRMMINFSIPLFTGGFVCLAFMKYNLVFFIAPSTLIFYGLSLLMVARDTLDEIRKLGILEIILGILSFFFLEYDYIFWILGFGFLHIIYGIIMRNKYDKKIRE